ncbi:YbaN family protein [Deinococcus pimensis]|uniref:YbaN family protein n=1 Tax=Deinococcus pimensis TaxID=309888 RepID=UPI0005EB7DF9|nr:YbaN family protein [Deinococcus pimensis]
MNDPRPRAPLPAPLRGLLIALGFVLVALGFVGLVLPGFPGTVWFVLAAACFARSSPRFERWLLGLPVVGELVADFRAGRGMPLRAKVLASVMIAVAVGVSAWRFIPVWEGRVAWVLVGLVGIWYVTLRVPTRAPRGDT